MRKLAGPAIAALAILAAAGTARAADDVSLRLNWYLGGLHTPFYLGKDSGLYAKEGINLTINEGRGSANTAQQIAARADHFGMADSGSLMLGASRGLPIKSVMSLLNASGFGVISLAETGIKEPKDLKGKRLAATAGDALTQLLPALLKVNGLKREDINLVMVDPPAKVVAVLEKKADALLGGIDDQYFLIEAKGAKPAALRFGDIGVETVGITLVAHNETVRDKPDLVRRFVKASQASWEAAKKDPDAAVRAALKVKPDLNFESTKKQLVVDIRLLESAATKGKPIGWGAPSDWQATYELLKEYREMKTDLPATAFYTNEFVPN